MRNRVASAFKAEKIRDIVTTLSLTIRLLIAANADLGCLILLTLGLEATYSSKMSVLTRLTKHHILKDDILDSHSHRILTYYISVRYIRMRCFSTGIIKYYTWFCLVGQPGASPWSHWKWTPNLSCPWKCMGHTAHHLLQHPCKIRPVWSRLQGTCFLYWFF
jgi:hypothetical protein